MVFTQVNVRFEDASDPVTGTWLPLQIRTRGVPAQSREWRVV
jgi:hypothetical protein